MFKKGDRVVCVNAKDMPYGEEGDLVEGEAYDVVENQRYDNCYVKTSKHDSVCYNAERFKLERTQEKYYRVETALRIEPRRHDTLEEAKDRAKEIARAEGCSTVVLEVMSCFEPSEPKEVKVA